MKNILLVYSPFCSPASPPYSLTNIHAFLKNNLKIGFTLDVLDLNLSFHKKKFSGFQKYFKTILTSYDSEEYNRIVSDYKKLTSDTYIKNNKLVVKDQNPELFNELLNEITEKKPDLVAFSIVYSSQCFYTMSLIKELKKLGIKSVVGGPAINSKLRDIAYNTLNNELDLLEFIVNETIDHDSLNFNSILDFNIWDLDNYFTPRPVIPLKTCNTCFYQQCTFCTHHGKQKYFEFSLDNIKKSILVSKINDVFFVDDMISKKRLLEIANIVKPLNISWTCQLRPTIDLDRETLTTLRDSGLKMVLWGVESGNNRILKLINKGTNKEDIKSVLSTSHNAGIKNVAFIIFGFPTETKEEFLETIDFLKDNSESIDLALTSVFGLQRGTKIFNNPRKFGIKKIIETERTVLEPKIDYEVVSGLSNDEASLLRQKYKKTLDKLNKFPKGMNFFREHMLVLI